MDFNLNSGAFNVGVDIGGSHITTALIDLQDGAIHNLKRERVNSHGPAEEIITCWVKTIADQLGLLPDRSVKIGIAMPGPFDYEQGISFIRGLNKYEALYGLNLKEILSDRLSVLPANIRFRNDAEAFLAGEVWAGAAKGFNRVIGVTLGTGLGSARSCNGKTEDANLGPSPFLDSIADEYLSTRWFVERYMQLTGKTIRDVREFASIVAEDAFASQVMNEFTETLALFLRQFIEHDDPEAVIIGGNISNAHPLFLPALEEKLAPEFPGLIFKVAELGERAAMLGATRAWSDSQEYSGMSDIRP